MKTLLNNNELTKLWIIEDNAGDLMLLEEVLIDLGFKSKNIRHFIDIQMFEEALKEDCPDVLLLDLFLPGSQGLETFKRIMPVTERFPVIVLSGLDSMNTAFESVKLGAQDYLIKDEMNDEMINKMINYAIERFANIIDIKKSEEKYRILFQSIPLSVIMLDENNTVLEINDSAKSLLETNDSLKGNLYFDAFEEESVRKIVNDALVHSKSTLIKLKSPQKKPKYLEQTSTKSHTINGIRSLVTLTDRTEIVESELNRSRIVHETLDDERNRFSKELHDGLAQYLVVLNLHLEMLKGIDTRVDEGLVSCSEAVNTSLKMVRSISYNLSPPDMDKGLVPALKALFSRLENVNNVHFELSVSDHLQDIDFSFIDEYSIFRMVQEFINNSLKYSECTIVHCSIDLTGHHLCIEITDDGKGFDIEAVKKGLGLENMKQRAFAAGFDLNLSSEIGQGTRLLLRSDNVIAE